MIKESWVLEDTLQAFSADYWSAERSRKDTSSPLRATLAHKSSPQHIAALSHGAVEEQIAEVEATKTLWSPSQAFSPP